MKFYGNQYFPSDCGFFCFHFIQTRRICPTGENDVLKLKHTTFIDPVVLTIFQVPYKFTIHKSCRSEILRALFAIRFPFLCFRCFPQKLFTPAKWRKRLLASHSGQVGQEALELLSAYLNSQLGSNNNQYCPHRARNTVFENQTPFNIATDFVWFNILTLISKENMFHSLILFIFKILI